MSKSLRYFSAKLPDTILHLVTCGSDKSDPLIMVPATISEIDNWTGLVKFMAQKYKVYFFELPGHGKSTAYVDGFSSVKLGETVGYLADNLGYERFSLMGFSFGGILALETLRKNYQRIDASVILAPCVSHEAIEYSNSRKLLVLQLTKVMKNRSLQKKLLRLINSPKTISWFMWLLSTLGHVEIRRGFREKLLQLPEQTLDVLVSQVNEILTADFTDLPKFDHPCFFSMSINDPLLNYRQTHDFMREHFSNLMVEELAHPYHQPPKPFSVKELNKDFKHLLTQSMG